jgi:outer membrane protein OmpA-like peptidoglycan-associated protein
LVGPAGPAGRAGPAGTQGKTGAPGARGSATEGVTGAIGPAGEPGSQGLVGATGAPGGTQSGVAGAIGPAGEAGPQGPVGATGAQGPLGEVKSWTVYQDFTFDNNSATLHRVQNDKVLAIARHLRENPSQTVAIDSSQYKSGNKDLADRRSRSIREALINAGVPSESIRMGTYGNKNVMRSDRTSVLFGN